MKLLVGLTLLALLSVKGQAQDGLRLKFGTWKLNLEKSQFPAGAPPLSDTRVYEDRGGGVIMSTHATVDLHGKEALTIYAAKFDGKQYPVVTRGLGVLSSIAFQVIDPYSESFVLTRDGKVAVRGVTTVSKDGKTLTMTLNATNAQGQKSQGLSIYERR
jgi:hypothetical protein